MNRESVLALKEEISTDVLARMMGRLRARSTASAAAWDTPRASVIDLDGYNPGVALGIVPGARGEDRLAVRIQDRRVASDARTLGSIVKEIERRSRGEVDIRIVGNIAAASRVDTPWHRNTARPVRPGCSIAHYQCSAGTIAGFFRRARHADRRFILSNNHVLAYEDRASIGDAILQPGPLDGGSLPTSRVGLLVAKVPLFDPGSGTNVVDAAIADIDPDVTWTLELEGETAPWIRALRTAPLDEGQAVSKVGRTTGRTPGVVTAIEVDGVWVGYSTRGHLRFSQQIEIEGNGLSQFAARGDSGSMILDDNRAACGLLFAVAETGGPNGTGLAYANPIDKVVEALGLEFPAPPGVVSAS